MRLVVIALLAASFTGAAWAGSARASSDCESRADAITESIQAAFDRTLDAIDHAELHEAVLAEIEAEIEVTMAELEVEMASMGGDLEWMDEAYQTDAEARIEAVLERMEVALERADYQGAERPARFGPPDAPKRWRPRY